METLKEYYYTYYSYEEWGRGYIGSRGCECLPEEDVKYFGSFKDKTFNPTQKIILEIYETREEAYADEIILQQHYKVVENSHFANRAYQTSTKFYVSREKAIENGKIGGKIGGNKAKKNKIGIYGMTKEQRSEASGKGAKMQYKNKIGIHGMTKEQIGENGKKGGKISGKITTSQQWQCTETGYVSTPGGLSSYQRKRGIDTSKRVKIL